MAATTERKAMAVATEERGQIWSPTSKGKAIADPMLEVAQSLPQPKP